MASLLNSASIGFYYTTCVLVDTLAVLSLPGLAIQYLGLTRNPFDAQEELESFLLYVSSFANMLVIFGLYFAGHEGAFYLKCLIGVAVAVVATVVAAFAAKVFGFVPEEKVAVMTETEKKPAEVMGGGGFRRSLDPETEEALSRACFKACANSVDDGMERSSGEPLSRDEIL